MSRSLVDTPWAKLKALAPARLSGVLRRDWKSRGSCSLAWSNGMSGGRMWCRHGRFRWWMSRCRRCWLFGATMFLVSSGWAVEMSAGSGAGDGTDMAKFKTSTSGQRCVSRHGHLSYAPSPLTYMRNKHLAGRSSTVGGVHWWMWSTNSNSATWRAH
jgi:hypothetical protein